MAKIDANEIVARDTYARKSIVAQATFKKFISKKNY